MKLEDENPRKAPSIQPSSNGLITEVVDALYAENLGLRKELCLRPTQHFTPSRDKLIKVMEYLRTVLFPGYFGPTDLTQETMRFYMGSILDKARQLLEDQMGRGFCFTCSEEEEERTCLSDSCTSRARTITDDFLRKLPEIRRILATDVLAAYEGDPAAISTDETIFCYPGVLAITNHRVAHEFYKMNVPIVPRIIAEHAHSITGIDIHPGAEIGPGFFIDHGTGVVIGETCIIGKNVRIYQGVTLGAVSFPMDDNGKPIKGIARHPIVEDGAIIYSGATILGRVTIGKGSVIGGNVWLTRDVKPSSRILQTPSKLSGFSEKKEL